MSFFQVENEIISGIQKSRGVEVWGVGLFDRRNHRVSRLVVQVNMHWQDSETLLTVAVAADWNTHILSLSLSPSLSLSITHTHNPHYDTSLPHNLVIECGPCCNSVTDICVGKRPPFDHLDGDLCLVHVCLFVCVFVCYCVILARTATRGKLETFVLEQGYITNVTICFNETAASGWGSCYVGGRE